MPLAGREGLCRLHAPWRISPRLLIRSRREMHLMMPETCSWKSLVIKAECSLHLTLSG